MYHQFPWSHQSQSKLQLPWQQLFLHTKAIKAKRYYKHDTQQSVCFSCSRGSLLWTAIHRQKDKHRQWQEAWGLGNKITHTKRCLSNEMNRKLMLITCHNLVSRCGKPIISMSRLKWLLSQVKGIKVNRLCVWKALQSRHTVYDHERSGLGVGYSRTTQHNYCNERWGHTHSLGF